MRPCRLATITIRDGFDRGLGRQRDGPSLLGGLGRSVITEAMTALVRTDLELAARMDEGDHKSGAGAAAVTITRSSGAIISAGYHVAISFDLRLLPSVGFGMVGMQGSQSQNGETRQRRQH